MQDKLNKIEFVIDRSKWRNAAHGLGMTALLNKEGYQCCLGFCCEQAGIGRNELLGVISPFISWDVLPDMLVGEAICINDRDGYTDEEREAALVATFERYGYTIKFEGSYK